MDIKTIDMEYWKNLDLADIEYFCEFDLVWKTEEWRDVKSYENIYKVSDLGRVVCLRKSKIRFLRQRKSPSGYLRTNFHLNGKRKTRHIHQLVAIAFLNFTPNGQEFVPNHKNFIKTDNRKLNLEIVTNRENSNRKHIKSSSEFVGVDYHKRTKKWRSRIVYKNKLIHLGMFESELSASKAYQDKLKEI